MTRWLALLTFFSLAAAQAATPVEALRATAELAAPFSPAVASLDPRVQVAGCNGPLIAELTNVRDRQATVQVRCEQPRWQLYVPVRATGGQDVMALKRSIAGGTVIRAEDIERVSRKGAGADYGAFNRPDDVVGLQTRRALPAGRVLSPADVINPPLVKRGDQIAIEVQTATVTIRMNGEALADGGFGQRIPVRNVSSGKRLEAIVRSEGTVEVPR